MRLMGDTNWYMPAWLKKIVPELREGPTPALAPAGGSAMVAAVRGNGHAASPNGDPFLPAAMPERMAGQLVRTGGPMNADVITLPRARPFRIGRDETSDLQVFDVRISRHHAKIEHRRGEYIITDLGSTNGVFINGERITQPTVLRHNDALEIANTGAVTFRFEQRSLSEPPNVMAARTPRTTDE
jgi:hypothetical protein